MSQTISPSLNGVKGSDITKLVCRGIPPGWKQSEGLIMNALAKLVAAFSLLLVACTSHPAFSETTLKDDLLAVAETQGSVNDLIMGIGEVKKQHAVYDEMGPVDDATARRLIEAFFDRSELQSHSFQEFDAAAQRLNVELEPIASAKGDTYKRLWAEVYMGVGTRS